MTCDEKEKQEELIDYTYEASYTLTVTARDQDEADEKFQEKLIEAWNSEGTIWDIFSIEIEAKKKK